MLQRAPCAARPLLGRTLVTLAMPPKRKATPESQAGASSDAASAPAKRGGAAAKPPPGPVVWTRALRPAPLGDDVQQFRVLSWNIAGFRAHVRKCKEGQAGISSLAALVAAERADVLCLQETKLQQSNCAQADVLEAVPPGWHASWNCSTEAKGYSGTAIFSRQKPLSVTNGIGAAVHDGEGRVITAEFDDCFVVNVYVPNSGAGLKRLDYRLKQWDTAFSDYLAGLQERKPVVLTGDLNVAPQEIDIHSPSTNLRSASFTPEERASFASLLLGGRCGFVDCFRAQYPETVAYTTNARANNKGWRLDHFLVSQALCPARVHECYMMPEWMGSDHCPIGLVIKKD